MKKVKKMAFGGMSSRGPATPPAAPMRPQAAPLRGLNPQASLAKPDRAASQLTQLQRANIAHNQAQAAAAPKNFTTTGTFPSPQTGMPAARQAVPLGQSLRQQTAPSAGPLQRAAQPGAIAKSQSQILDAARAAAFRSGANLNPQTGLAAGPLQRAAANMAQQKFNPVSAGKLDAALGGGNTFSKLAAAKPMSGPQTGMMKKGGAVKAKPKKYAKGGSVSSASKRADGIATKGKTKGRFI